MGTSWWRIRRMERRSLVQLRRADRADACGEGTAGAAPFGVADSGAGGFALASLTTPPPADGAPQQEQEQGQGRAQGGVRGETKSGSEQRTGGRGSPIGLVDSAAEDLQTLALILVGLVAAGFVLALLGRLRRTGGPAR
jgi:hypothetical protein